MDLLRLLALLGHGAMSDLSPLSAQKRTSISHSKSFGKPIEFEKGKAGVVVPSKDKLPTVIDTLIAAVRSGELDDMFSQAAKTGSVGKAKKAA